MSAFANAIAAGLSSIGSASGETIVYTRGADSVTLQAVPGSTTFETVDANDLPISSTSTDFILKASELVIAGSVITPRRGDRITWSGRIYEVLTDGSQVYRWSDRARTRIRVHTKEVSA